MDNYPGWTLVTNGWTICCNWPRYLSKWAWW